MQKGDETRFRNDVPYYNVYNKEWQNAWRQVYVLINRMCAISVVVNTSDDYLTCRCAYFFKRVKCECRGKTSTRRNGLVANDGRNSHHDCPFPVPSRKKNERGTKYEMTTPVAIRVLHQYAVFHKFRMWRYYSLRNNNFVVTFINWLPVNASQITIFSNITL